MLSKRFGKTCKNCKKVNFLPANAGMVYFKEHDPPIPPLLKGGIKGGLLLN